MCKLFSIGHMTTMCCVCTIVCSVCMCEGLRGKGVVYLQKKSIIWELLCKIFSKFQIPIIDNKISCAFKYNGYANYA